MHHRLLDQRSLSLHCLMVDKIKQDPGLYFKIGQTIHRWKRIVSQDSTPLLLEWEKLYHAGPESCLKMATEKSERADQLSQASPFCGILTLAERTHFLKKWKASN